MRLHIRHIRALLHGHRHTPGPLLLHVFSSTRPALARHSPGPRPVGGPRQALAPFAFLGSKITAGLPRPSARSCLGSPSAAQYSSASFSIHAFECLLLALVMPTWSSAKSRPSARSPLSASRSPIGASKSSPANRGRGPAAATFLWTGANKVLFSWKNSWVPVRPARRAPPHNSSLQPITPPPHLCTLIPDHSNIAASSFFLSPARPILPLTSSYFYPNAVVFLSSSSPALRLGAE